MKKTTWRGRSGKRYEFNTYRMGSDFPKRMDSSGVPPAAGVYVFSRKVVVRDRPVYIGWSGVDLKGRIISGWTSHKKRRCVVCQKANRLHILAGEAAEDGNLRAIERDLIDGNPTPCNKN